MRTVSDMQKTALMDSESIIQKFMLGLVQGIEEETLFVYMMYISVMCN